MRCACFRRKNHRENRHDVDFGQMILLPITPPFFFRFSSGTCILSTTSVYTSVYLPFFFRDCSFWTHAFCSSVYSSVSLPFFFRDLRSEHYLRLHFRFPSVFLPGLQLLNMCLLCFPLVFRFSSVFFRDHVSASMLLFGPLKRCSWLLIVLFTFPC